MIATLTGLNKLLAGQDDKYLTTGLLTLAGLLVWFALAAPPEWKAIVLTWVVLP